MSAEEKWDKWRVQYADEVARLTKEVESVRRELNDRLIERTMAYEAKDARQCAEIARLKEELRLALVHRGSGERAED